MSICIKTHSLDCIGCGSCDRYNMDYDDGVIVEDRDEALTEEELYDIEDYELRGY